MRSTKLIAAIAFLFVLGAFTAYEGVHAQMKPSGKSGRLRLMNTQEQIEALLRSFLVGAGRNDPAAHDRFWADDLIYTGASGKVRSKADIMQAVREDTAKPVDPAASKTTYDAEDVTVHDLGDYAILNFRLAAHTGNRTDYYRNTGTFAKRNGEWKVIAWQATKIGPEKPQEKK